MNHAEKQALCRALDKDITLASSRISLPGISDPSTRQTLIKQLVDSIRRVRFVTLLTENTPDESCSNPNSAAFDPVKAAAFHAANGRVDEACWLVFLAIHIGKNRIHGWSRAKAIYGAMGANEPWSWSVLCANPTAFYSWLEANYSNIPGAFGNHRKYESLRPNTTKSPQNVVSSYLTWVGPEHKHQRLFSEALSRASNQPRATFGLLYTSMNSVVSFGRTARFDYLTMLGKLGLLNIEPGKTFMSGSTGPIKGARLLFGGLSTANLAPRKLEGLLAELEDCLSLGPMGMQVLEDALCNWQKSPNSYQLFMG